MIRQATAEDRAAMQRLYQALCPAEPVKVIASRIEEINESKHHFLLVHTTEGRVDGSVFLSLCPDPMFGTLPFAVVENLIVDPAADGGDIARELMTAAEELAREHRSTKMMLLSHHLHTDAHRLFQSLGYDGDLSVAFRKSLGSEKELGSNA